MKIILFIFLTNTIIDKKNMSGIGTEFCLESHSSKREDRFEYFLRKGGLEIFLVGVK